jgi:branched-chain amino acid transport system substrate-binding protein
LDIRDTETSPQVGRRKAEALINDGADFIVGNYSSATALSISELTTNEEVIYGALGSTLALTGEECSPYTFNFGSSGIMQASGSLGYALEQDMGDSVYEIAMDYVTGQDIQQWNEEEMAPRHNAEYLGSTFTPLDKSDFSTEITKALDSGADIIMATQAGSPGTAFMQQVGEFGVMEDEDRVVVQYAGGERAVREIPQKTISHENYVTGVNWHHTSDSEAAQSFTEKFIEEHGVAPGSFAGSINGGTRTILRKINETGSTNADDLRDALEGAELKPNYWPVSGHPKLRTCDHRATIPRQAATGLPPDETTETQRLEILHTFDNPEELMRDCSETGCELS